MEAKGKVVQVLGIETGKGTGQWRKQTYVLEQDGQYAKKVAFSVWGDNIEKFNLKVGQRIVVDVDIESREYNGKWYTDVKAYKLTSGQDLTAYSTVADDYNQSDGSSDFPF